MLKCEDCKFSGHYAGELVCWLYSDDEIMFIDEELAEWGCEDFERREDG